MDIVPQDTKSSLPTAKIVGLEIFSAGRWNGDTYSTADLDSMVDAFGKVSFSPFAKAGHEDGQEDPATCKQIFGAPALGYVEKLYRMGDKLMADIRDVPRRFAELIKAGSYRRVSSEIYWNYDEQGQKLPRVLKAVAFLGAKIPALTNLKAIENLFSRNASGAMRAYDENGQVFKAYSTKEFAFCPTGPGGGIDNSCSSVEKVGAEHDRHSVITGATPRDRMLARMRAEDGIDAAFGASTLPEDAKAELKKNLLIAQGHSRSLKDDTPAQLKGARTHDGRVPDYSLSEAKYMKVESRDGKFCVVDDQGNVKGEYPTEAEAQAKASGSDTTDPATKADDSKKKGFFDMDEKQFNEKLAAELAKSKAELIAATGETAKKYEDENAALRGEVRALQKKNREADIKGWIGTMKRAGKVLPVEEPKLFALLSILPEGTMEVSYFSKDGDKQVENKKSAHDMLRELFEKRETKLFAEVSKNEGEPQGASDEELGVRVAKYEDAGVEVDRRAQELIGKTPALKYSDALSQVLRGDAKLAVEYNSQEKH